MLSNCRRGPELVVIRSGPANDFQGCFRARDRRALTAEGQHLPMRGHAVQLKKMGLELSSVRKLTKPGLRTSEFSFAGFCGSVGCVPVCFGDCAGRSDASCGLSR
jgi:hypothetical protein